MIRALKTALIGALAVASLALGTTAQAQYTFHAFSYPGASTNQAWSINRYLQVPGNAEVPGTGTVGFIYDFRVDLFTTLFLGPGGTTALPIGINDLIVKVGTLYDPAFTPVAGFTFNGVSYTAINRPGVAALYPREINNAGIATGYQEATAGGPGTGWTYDTATGIFTDLAIGGSFTIAQGINEAGEIVGSASGIPGEIFPGSADGAHGFLRSPGGVVTYFRINGLPTRARGINDSGRIVGWFDDVDGTKGFVTTVPATGGYVDIAPSAYRVLAVPGYLSTMAQGINNAGYISGILTQADGTGVGFVAVPPETDLLEALEEAIEGWGLPKGQTRSYIAKIDAAQAAIERGNTAAACGPLKALVKLTWAQVGKKLTPAQAQQIFEDAETVSLMLGC